MTRLLLGIAAGLLAATLWRVLIKRAGSPLSDLEEAYPYRDSLLDEMFPLTRAEVEQGSLIPPDVAQALEDSERQWLAGDAPFQRLMRGLKSSG